MNNLLAMPLVLPLATAAICLLGWGKPAIQRGVSLVGSIGLLGVAIALLASVLNGGTRTLAVGGWRPPIGIVLVADTMGAMLVLVTAIVGVAVVVDSRQSL